MKRMHWIPCAVAALAAPVLALSQDKTEPGKASDAVKNSPSTAPARPERATGATEYTPGKSADAVQETDPANTERRFSGPITAVNPEERTITVSDRTLGSHQIRVGTETQIQRSSKSATWDDLKVGQNVDGLCRGNTEMSYAETLNIGG